MQNKRRYKAPNQTKGKQKNDLRTKKTHEGPQQPAERQSLCRHCSPIPCKTKDGTRLRIRRRGNKRMTCEQKRPMKGPNNPQRDNPSVGTARQYHAKQKTVQGSESDEGETKE